MDSFDKFYNKSLKFLSYRSRSEKEVRDYLLKKKTDQKIIDQVIEKLKTQRFINDREFARIWFSSRVSSKPRSIKLIKLELKRKGIDKSLIETAIEDSEFKVNDLEIAKNLVQKRVKRYKGHPKEEVYEKLMRFLASKGFDYEIIKEALKVFDGE